MAFLISNTLSADFRIYPALRILIFLRKSLFLFSFISISSLCSHVTEVSADVKDSVVKIYTVYDKYNYHEPWQTMGQQLAQGSGCVIEGKRILTNAHVVSDQTFVQVRRAGHAKKYTATVVSSGHDCDLAILKVNDPEFFKGIVPLTVGELPMVRDKVAVFGYPHGGDTLSITEGIVSRIEHLEYAHSQVNLLAAQLDAPINQGNSGGPVIKDDSIVGIAFQGMYGPTYENIGYMVPPPVIRNFLRDVENGTFDGIPELGIKMQKMENPDLRRRYKLPDNRTGALITKVYPDSPALGKVESGDVLLSIDDMDVENDGTIVFRPGERTYLGYAWQRKQISDELSMKLLRDGKELLVTVRLVKSVGFDKLVPNKRYDKPATYYIVGGLLFAPLTRNYLEEYGSERDWAVNAPKDLTALYINGEPTAQNREVILLVKVLADEINVGYHAFTNGIITRVNGKNISTIRDLVNAFESNSDEFHVIEDLEGYRLVLDRKSVLERGGDILKRYRVPFDRSEDLRVKSYSN